MTAKKNPYFFTIGFNAKKAAHVQAAQILNQYGRGEKADYIATAILAYEGKRSEEFSSIDPEFLRDMIRQMMKEEYGKGPEKKEERLSEETVIDISERAEIDPEVAQCLSRGLAAFRKL